jgi:hypothetical protein
MLTVLFYVQEVRYIAGAWMHSKYGQFLCSKQKLSTYINVGSVTSAWSFLAIHGITTLQCPYMLINISVYLRYNFVDITLKNSNNNKNKWNSYVVNYCQ